MKKKMSFKEIVALVIAVITLIAACWFRVYAFSYSTETIENAMNEQDNTEDSIN